MGTKMQEKSLLKNMLWNSVKSFVTLGFPLLTFIYISRVLEVEGLGKINFSNSFIAYFSMLSMLGITNYSIREASLLRNKREKLSIFTREIIVINMVAMVLSYIILFICIYTVPKLSNYKEILIIYSTTIFFNVIGIEWLYSALEDFKYITLRTFIINIISLCMLLFFVQSKYDVRKCVIIQVTAVCANNLFNFFHAKKYVDLRIEAKIHAKKHIKKILLLFGMTLFIQVFTYLDLTMLGFICGDEAVGLYCAANKMSLVSAIITSLTAVMFPRIAYYTSENKNEKIYELITYAINYIFLLALPCIVGLIIFSPQLIVLFSGKSYCAAKTAARIMSMRVLLVPLNSFILVHLFIPLGNEKKNLISTGVAAILNFIVNLILIPIWNQDGAAIATIIAELIELLFNFYFLSKIVKISKLFKCLHHYMIGSLGVLVVWKFFSLILENEYLLMLFTILFSIYLYSMFLYLLKNEFLLKVFNILKTFFK